MLLYFRKPQCMSSQDQDDYQGALNKLHFTITRALAVNPSIHLEVFIHKVDTLTTDYQQGIHKLWAWVMVDIKRDIQQRVGDELADVGLVDVPIEYHMTSIFDHSIFEAFSKIIQKLIPQLHTLQDLLNNLVDVHTWSCTTNCRLRIYKRRFCLT